MKMQFANGRPARVKNYGGQAITIANMSREITCLYLFAQGNGEKLYTTFEMRHEKYNKENGFVLSAYVNCKSFKAFKRHLRKYCSHLKEVEVYWHAADPTQDRVVFL